MGCHTWFYQETKRTFQQAKQVALENIKNDINKWENYDSKTDESFIAYGWNELTKQETLFELKAILSRIENNEEFTIWNKQPDGDDINYYNPVTKRFYVDNKITHDIIRVGNYPNIKFFSFDEMFNWIEKHRTHADYNTSKITELEISRLKEYWDKYPDSMVCFD